MSFNPSQPRDQDGKWTDTGGSSRAGRIDRLEQKAKQKYLNAVALNESLASSNVSSYYAGTSAHRTTQRKAADMLGAAYGRLSRIAKLKNNRK